MIIDNINFTSLNTENGSYVVPVKNNKDHIVSQRNIGIEENDPVTTILNAVEIDWNGANINGTIINTTSDLLNWIKSIRNNSGSTDQSNTYNKDTIDILVGELEESKANVKDVYDKDTIDDIVAEFEESKANVKDVYDKNTIDNIISEIYNENNSYTKDDIDHMIGSISESINNINDNDYISREEFTRTINELLELINLKVNKSDIYTKDDIDSMINGLVD